MASILFRNANVFDGKTPHLLEAHEVFVEDDTLLPAFDILVSVTSMGAEILMEDGRLGVVAPGAHADLIVVDGDPLKDIRVLAKNGSTLPVIMKAGRFHKKLI